MAERETLIQKFAKKYFTNTPANMLRSINAGKFLYRYFVPDKEVPEDPVTLLNITHTVMLSDEQNLSDENFVRAMLNYFNSDPSLITFDIVADLLESDAYKRFGRTSEDNLLKTQFENWLVNESMLAYINSHPSFDVVMNLNSIKRTATALGHGNLLEHGTIVNRIDQQLMTKQNEFDDDFVSHADENAFDKLVAIVHDRNLSYTDKIKKIYGVLCDEDRAAFFTNNLDAITMGAENSQARNAMLEGAGLTINKILFAFAKRQGWTKEKYQQVVLKFPVEERAQQFEEHAAQLGTTQAVSTTSTQANHEPTENIVTTQSEANATQAVNDAQNEVSDDLVSEPNRGNRPQVKFNPVFDVVKTFGITLGGATAISTITAIPGVGSIVGPVLGITTIVGAGVVAGLSNLRKAKLEAQEHGEKLKKSDAAKIALKAGIAMMGKAVPYAMAMALGPKWRAVGAGLMMVKATFHDLERRVNLQRDAVAQAETQTAEQPKGIRAHLEHFVDRVKNIVHNVKGADVAKAVAYGAAKGAAVYLGGQIGSDFGSAVGRNISFNHQDGINMHVDTAQMKEDLSATKLGKLVGSFGHKTTESLENLGHDVTKLSPMQADANEDLPQETGYEQYKREQLEAYQKYLHDQHLTEENLNRLDNLGKVELTDNARLTAYSANNKQFFNGKRELLYNEQQEKAMIETMEKLGVKDPYGLLRKLYSTVQFERSGEIENNGFSETMNHLENGFANNHDVDNLIKSDEIINKEGGLNITLGGNEQSVVHQNPVSMSHVGNDRFDDQITETVKTEPKIDPVAVSDVGNDRLNGHTAEPVIDNDVPTDAPAVEEQPRQSEPVATSRVDNGRIGAHAVTVLDDEVELGDNITTNENETVKLSSVSGDRFENGVKEAIITNESIENESMEPAEPVDTSRVDNNRFKSSDTSPVDTDNSSAVDDVTALSGSTEIPTWNNDGSYAATVYQDLVNKCNYSGTSVDGSYCFTDKDGTYYEINPVTHQMHVGRITAYGRVANVDIDLTNNQMIEGNLTEHAHAAEVISQNLAHSTGYSAEEIEALKLTKSAHEILADENSSFVDRQRATVQLEKLGASMQDSEVGKVDSVVESNDVVKNSSVTESANEAQGNKLFEFAPKDLGVKNIVKPGVITGLPNKNSIINVPNIYGWDL
ncbi:MAG: hypothetical protein J5580_01975 [Clostridia bacterium]|nr:hypothetical protein [Clostridia bacterium]